MENMTMLRCQLRSIFFLRQACGKSTNQVQALWTNVFLPCENQNTELKNRVVAIMKEEDLRTRKDPREDRTERDCGCHLFGHAQPPRQPLVAQFGWHGSPHGRRARDVYSSVLARHWCPPRGGRVGRRTMAMVGRFAAGFVVHHRQHYRCGEFNPSLYIKPHGRELVTFSIGSATVGAVDTTPCSTQCPCVFRQW